MKLDQRSEAKSQAVSVSSGEGLTQEAIEQQGRFKVGSGGRVLDGAHAIAQVELAGWSGRGAQEALQSPPQVCGFSGVGFGREVGASQQKHRSGGGDRRKSFRVALRRELQPLG